MVAQENEVDFLIDDGLVISKGRIMAGKSAKSERNLVRAIRRALFQFPDHRKAVRAFLQKSAPCKIMIIATSISMAEKTILTTQKNMMSYPVTMVDVG